MSDDIQKADSNNEEDDIVFEDNTEITELDHKLKFDKLKHKITELSSKNSELLNSWQKDRAEFINSRKRDEVEKQEFFKFANKNLIEELLPVLDAFSSAMKNKNEWEKVDQNWRVGMEYINSQLHKILSDYGLKIINPVGEVYDSKRDDAIEMTPVDSEEKNNKILDVIQVGYELYGKEIRAPKVKVGHYE